MAGTVSSPCPLPLDASSSLKDLKEADIAIRDGMKYHMLGKRRVSEGGYFVQIV